MRPNMLGGGCVHCGMAMRLWDEQVGLLAKVGQDFPAKLEMQLKQFFIPDGIVRTDYAQTPHFKQYYRADGTRYETFSSPHEEMLAMLPVPANLPKAWKSIHGVHLHCRKEHVADWIDTLKAKGAQIVLWEPIDHFDDVANRGLFIEYARKADVVSPNLAEIRTLTGKYELEDILSYCHHEGFNKLLLRMGSQGVLVMDEEGKWFITPPYPETNILDATGAGNACCGGFIAGLFLTKDLQTASKYANISSSLALRQFGAVYPLEPAQQEALKRLAKLK
ncbi:MAG: carbohydrate kinase family protein [Anaerolineaceae bacterium]